MPSILVQCLFGIVKFHINQFISFYLCPILSFVAQKLFTNETHIDKPSRKNNCLIIKDLRDLIRIKY